MTRSEILRTFAFALCLIIGLSGMQHRLPWAVAGATLVATVFTTPLRRRAKHFKHSPNRKEGHV